MVGVKNSKKPEKQVSFRDKSNSVKCRLNMIDYPNWTGSVSLKNGYTNYLKNEKQCSKNFFLIVDKLFPFIQQHYKSFYNGSLAHCHLLKGDEKKVAEEIIFDLHYGLQLSPDTEIWEFGYGQAIRLICIIVRDAEDMNIYPMFVDHHHLIYPSERHNEKDFKSCKFSPKQIYK